MKIYKIAILFLTISAFSQEIKTDSKNKSEDIIYSSATIEYQPEYEGGIQGFREYIAKNFTIPPQAAKQTIQGKIFVEFVIEKDGSVIDIKVVRGLGYGLDEEAQRVVSNCKKWKPGEIKGEKVKARYVLPIAINIVAK
ncbi:MAG: energy transducer TonB [Limnohabitans sp.]|nr:energy transducer TonB [Limnohabitans sp.]